MEEGRRRKSEETKDQRLSPRAEASLDSPEDTPSPDDGCRSDVTTGEREKREVNRKTGLPRRSATTARTYSQDGCLSNRTLARELGARVLFFLKNNKLLSNTLKIKNK